MSFYNEYTKYRDFNFENFFEKLTMNSYMLRAINKEKLDEYDFLTLLSERTEKHLEEMAQSNGNREAYPAAFWEESYIFIYTHVPG